MNNNYFNFNPNSSFIRNVPNMGFNPMNSMRSVPGVIGLPRLSSLFGGSRALGASTASKLSFSSILTGAGKTLGVINQAIPVFYQVKPIWNNAKTMFKVAKQIKVSDNTKSNLPLDNNKTINNKTSNITKDESKKEESNSPTFFI